MPAALIPTDCWLVIGLAAAGLGMFLAALRRPAAALARVSPVCLGPLTYGSASDRRGGSRRRGARVKVRLADACARELGTGWVMNRSAGGLCLRVGSRLEAGTILSVRPVHAPGRTPWVQVEVKSCRAKAGDWEAGCRFVRRPTWNEMLHFG